MRMIFFCLLLNLHLKNFSQALRVGDKCPELVFENIINGTVHQESLSSLSGKVVLLDFGSTDCLPCLRLLPKLDSLEIEFKGNFKVFMITKEKKEKVKKFLESKAGKKVTVPFIAEDSVFHRLFPHHALPHEVWIGPDGYIAAITRHEYVTKQNIEFVLNGGRPKWPVKVEMEYDQTGPLWEYARAQGINTVNSTVTGYIEGVRSKSSGFKADSSGKGVRFINKTLLDMYMVAYQKSSYHFYPAQLMIESSISDRFFYKDSSNYFEEWTQKNSYCYEFFSKDPINKELVYERMKTDLDFYFRYVSFLEKRKLPCLVITRIGGIRSEKGKKGESISSIISYVNRRGEFPLVINETGLTIDELRNIYFDTDKTMLRNKENFFEIFSRYGFRIIEMEREIEVLTIVPRQI